MLNTYLALSLGDVATDVLESGEEFVGIALSVTIHGVEVSEGSTKTSDSLGTSSSELGAHLVENYTLKNRLAINFVSAPSLSHPKLKYQNLVLHTRNEKARWLLLCDKYLLATAFM
jgi:hypothetical protein